jgi:hypothetical protein
MTFAHIYIMYNTCYGGFTLSDAAIDKYKRRCPDGKNPRLFELDRDDQVMAQIVKELGSAANGQFSNIKLQRIPVEYRDFYTIHEFDGRRRRRLSAADDSGCLRVSLRLQMCVRPWSDYLMSYGAPGFEGDALDAHQPAEERHAAHAAQGPLPAFGRSRIPELDVMPLTTLKVLTWDLVCFAVPTSRVELVSKAVRARHPPPWPVT